MILPALSLSQPWVELVLDHGKDIENRTWACHKRGLFLIHAAQGMTRRGYVHALDFAAQALGHNIALPADIDRGGLLGAAEILDVIHPNRRDKGGTATGYHPQSSNPWLMDGCFGFVLGRRVRLPFRAMNGRQRWFNVELTAAEEATLRAAGLVPS